MAQVVAGVACSHVPFMVSPKNWERLSAGERANLRAGFDRARQILEAARPDVLITFADDHFDRCFYDNLPAFLVGVGETARGPAVADFGLPQVSVPIQSDLARFIVTEGLERGVDFAFSEELALDHAEMAPMVHLTPRWDIPIIPIVVNAFAPPMPSLQRCFDVGAFSAVRRALAGESAGRVPGDGRTFALGRTAGDRTINAEFDRWFLERLTRREIAEITTRYARHADLEAVAGNGGQEIRDWLAVAGAMPSRLRPQVLAYEPLQAWFTGTGIMSWSAI